MSDKKKGLRLLECVFLAGCFLILLGLLLPAVNHPGSHRRNRCATNLKNLALAAVQYENSRTGFPGYAIDFGTWTVGDPPFDPSDPDADVRTLLSHRKIGTWAVALLPWLDAQPTYEHWTQDRYPIVGGGSSKFALSNGISGQGFTTHAAPLLTIFQCPQDDRDATQGRNSYIANVGMYHFSPTGQDVWHLDRDDKDVTIDFARSMSVANGVFNNQFPGRDEHGIQVATGPVVKLSDFLDGQGFTALFSESLQAMPWHRAGFIDADDLVIRGSAENVRYEPTSRFTSGMIWHFEDDDSASPAPSVVAVHRINGTLLDVDLDDLQMTATNAADLARPSSSHVEGVNMAFADGATRFITETIDYRVYQALLTPDGEDSDVPDPSFQISDQLDPF